MVGHALSQRVKTQVQRQATNAHYQAALIEYFCKQDKLVGTKKQGLHVIAEKQIEREQRKAMRGNQKAEKERLESEWKRMMEHYAHQVVQWEETCRRLHEQHVMVKDLPKKPKQPLKPKAKEVDEEDVFHDEEEDGNGNGESVTDKP
jgi:hypothetical protein